MTDGSWLERLRAAAEAGAHSCPADALVGARLVAVEPGRAVLRYDFDGGHTNPPGVLHGGIITLLADSAMGTAFLAGLEGDAARVSGTNTGIHVDFLRPTTAGTLEAEAHVVHGGRTTALLEAEVRDGAGRLMAKASSRFLRLDAA